MTDRRRVLRGLVAGTVGGALAGTGLAGTAWPNTADANAAGSEDACGCCGSGAAAGGQRQFPNVPVLTHTGRRALFHRDLIQGKTVLVNFMSIKHHDVYPITRYLRRVHRELGDRAGRDVCMISLTIDAAHDTPHALRRFAEQQGIAGPGWLFLTGESEPLALLRASFFKGHAGHGHAEHGHAGGGQAGGGHAGGGPDCSLGVVRYGCEPTGIWGTVPAKAPPRWIVARCDWVRPRALPSGPPRRKGPPPLA